jgi:phosphatidylinositol alpha-mannosyltransferase
MTRDSGTAPQEPAVLFVCLARGVGGSSRSLATVLEHTEGRMTRILAAPSEGSFAPLVRERSLADHYLPIPSRGQRPRSRLSRPEAARRIASYVMRHRRVIRAIHANGPEELNLVVPAAWLAGVPIVVWSHARDVSPWMRRLSPVWRRVLRNRDVRWAAVSNTARGVLVESGLTPSDRVVLVPNPIDPGDVRADRRERNGNLVIGYLGSDAPYKGFQLLPDVIERTRDLPIHWSLFAAPRSKENAAVWHRLREFPEQLLGFPGKVADVREAYAACDVVFCPSLDESFGRVVAEAMMNGIPVVASDIEALRDLVGSEQAGLLFPSGDAAAAARAIDRLVADPRLRAKAGARGAVRAESFDARSVVAKLVDLYLPPQETMPTGTERA